MGIDAIVFLFGAKIRSHTHYERKKGSGRRVNTNSGKALIIERC
jgi:hypothetical protein